MIFKNSRPDDNHMAPEVEVKGLAKVINERIIVDRISFSVQEGEVFGLLGANGSGKTTTFNMLSGLSAPSSGTIRIHDHDIKDSGFLRRNIGLVTQHDSFYDTITVKENLRFFASQYGISGKETDMRVKDLLSKMKLSEKADSVAGRLSGGMKKRLNMACSLIHDPKVVFLDEPTVGLDPVVRHEIWDVIKGLHEMRKTIILTSHYMDEVEYLCSRVAVMFAGRIAATGTPQELKNRYKLKQMEDVFAYLMKPEA
jgi:ABC-2 type transport system ATP-binding protein